MSGPQTPTEPSAKTMSSRLLTMKFMQRAVASSPKPDPSTPDKFSPKRRKISENGYSTPPSAGLQAMQAALAKEESKRQEALDRQGNAAGETKWVLSFREGDTPRPKSQPLRTVKASYAMIDSSQEVLNGSNETEPWRKDQVIGRRSFGRFNRELEKSQKSSGESDSDSDSGEISTDEQDTSDNDEDDTGANAMIRQAAKQQEKAERKSKRKAEKTELERLAELAKHRKVNLNKLTSISSGGSTMGSKSDITCHRCGKKGHIQRDCPESQSQRPRKRDRTEGDIPYRQGTDSKKRTRR